MYRAYRLEAWNHTSALISSVLNLFADEGKALAMDQFNLVLKEEEAAKKPKRPAQEYPSGVGILKVFLPKKRR